VIRELIECACPANENTERYNDDQVNVEELEITDIRSNTVKNSGSKELDAGVELNEFEGLEAGSE
jgi:hypothetical protein